MVSPKIVEYFEHQTRMLGMTAEMHTLAKKMGSGTATELDWQQFVNQIKSKSPTPKNSGQAWLWIYAEQKPQDIIGDYLVRGYEKTLEQAKKGIKTAVTITQLEEIKEIHRNIITAPGTTLDTEQAIEEQAAIIDKKEARLNDFEKATGIKAITLLKQHITEKNIKMRPSDTMITYKWLGYNTTALRDNKGRFIAWTYARKKA